MHDLEKYYTRAAAHPVEYGIFIALSACLAILTLALLSRNKTNAVFWCVAGLILVELAFRNGDDLQFHANRVVGLADEFARGNFIGLLINPISGQAFPLFVYYSFLPYIIPVCLFFLGVSAYVSAKLTLAVYFLIFCSGLHLLFNKAAPRRSNPGDTSLAFLILSLFLCCTYVYGIWVLRDALGETAVYALIPWVVMALLSKKRAVLLILFFHLQLATHPLVFLQSLVCEFAMAYGISEMPWLPLARKMLLPMAIALVLASPFWLPQILWLNLIIGNSVMKLPFSATFLDLSRLFSPIYRYTLGPWTILGVGLMIVVLRGRLGSRAWLLTAGFVLMLAVQTTYLRGATLRVPDLNILQFVWRLMMPAAFLGLGALLAGFKANGPQARVALASLFVLAFANFVLVSFVYTPQYMNIEPYNQNSYIQTLRYENLSGVGVFAPDYSHLPQTCSSMRDSRTQAISYKDLKNGAIANKPFVSVGNAPIGMVSYEVDGAVLTPSACGRNLLLGPIPSGKTVTVDDARLRHLMDFRLLSLILGMILLAVTLAGSDPNRLQASEAR